MSLPNPMFDPEVTGQIPVIAPYPTERERYPWPMPEDRPGVSVDPDPDDVREQPAPTYEELAKTWSARRDEPPLPGPPAFLPPRLRTWTLPNGRFVLVLDHLGAGDVEWRDAANELRDRVGAAAVLAYADEVDVQDADVLVDVPADVAAEDEALLVKLRGMQTEKLAEYRRELDELREEAVLREAAHEGSRRDLGEALERMARTRELARAHGYTAIVEALTLPDDGPEGDATGVESAA